MAIHTEQYRRSEIDEKLVSKGWIIEEVERENPDDEVDIILSISPEEGTDHSLEDVVTVQASLGLQQFRFHLLLGKHLKQQRSFR